MVDLQRAVLEHQCDLGVAFDGDADRMFLVDENGGLIGGDIVTALVGIDTLKRNPRCENPLQPHLQPQRSGGDRRRGRRAAYARRSGTP